LTDLGDRRRPQKSKKIFANGFSCEFMKIIFILIDFEGYDG